MLVIDTFSFSFFAVLSYDELFDVSKNITVYIIIIILLATHICSVLYELTVILFGSESNYLGLVKALYVKQAIYGERPEIYILLFSLCFYSQTQVSQKDQQAEKYQRLLQEARNELHSVTDAHKAEVASLTARLHSQADSALSRLKEAALEAVNPPRPLHLTDSQLDRLRELEEMTEEQEKTNTRLRREVQQVKHEKEQDQQVSKTRLTRLQQELNDAKSQHQKEVSGLEQKLFFDFPIFFLLK